MGDGLSFCSFNSAWINVSIGLAGLLFNVGTAGRFSGVKDQWASYSAPWATQSVISFFCAAVSFLFDSGGGICTSGSVELIRRTSSLSLILPGTIALAVMAASR